MGNIFVLITWREGHINNLFRQVFDLLLKLRGEQTVCSTVWIASRMLPNTECCSQ